jgi:Signal peptide peptidase
MLGLGDIVIPGIFIALALRYDYHHFIMACPKHPFWKPYFYAGLFAYIAGLVTTMAVMHIFGAAQPALLYLRSVNRYLLTFFSLVDKGNLQPCLYVVIFHNGNNPRRAERGVDMD